jgi:hypothetical protein
MTVDPVKATNRKRVLVQLGASLADGTGGAASSKAPVVFSGTSAGPEVTIDITVITVLHVVIHLTVRCEALDTSRRRRKRTPAHLSRSSTP